MKKIFRTSVSIIAVISMVMSLSSCTLFKTMRENAEKAAQIKILDSPDDAEILSTFNSMLDKSTENALEIKEDIKFSAGNPEITKDGENAGRLADAGKQIKFLIMEAKPGASSRILENGTDDSLLKAVDEAGVLDYKCSRNISSENLTDEKGREMADEDGMVLTTQYVSDNTVHFNIDYFDIKNADGTDYTEEKDKKTEEESTTVIIAENETIESVFGSPADKNTVLENFECISEFLKVSDYDITYEKCSVYSDGDLSEGILNSVRFVKEMTVSAAAEGVGQLSGYGDIQIKFTLKEETVYSFTYDYEDDEEGNKDSNDKESEILTDEVPAEEISFRDEDISADESVLYETEVISTVN